MPLAQAVTPPLNPLPPVALVSTLDGVTTVLTAFLFVCLALPSLVRNRPQYYAAMGCLLGVILCHTVSLVFDASSSVVNALAVATGVLQLTAFLLLVLSVGGLTVKQLAGDMARAYEVVRRGETEKEVIIPIAGQVAGGRPRRPAEAGPTVYDADDDAT